MAHFYAVTQGNRGETTRCGSKNSGLTSTCASWNGCVNTTLYHDKESGKDMARVCLGKWQGRGTDTVIYDGPVDGMEG